jgi:small-conductance mechanosensitive channel
MPTITLSELYGNATRTLLTLAALLLTYVVINLIAMRRIESQKQRRRFRIRSFYITAIISLFLLARIWVEGFTHLLYALGLVSAALVISNKESIMNIIGWFIINWRELFIEDDLIQIQNFKGYVKHLGLMYVTLAEASDKGKGSISGRVIRVPNGWVSNNALINFSQTSHLIEQQILLIVNAQSDINLAKQILRDVVSFQLNKHYQNKKEYSMDYLRKRNHQYADNLSLEPSVSVETKHEKPSGILITIHYFCFARYEDKLHKRIWGQLLERLKANPQIELVFED